MNKDNPLTFEIPSKVKIRKLKLDDFVKLGFDENGECERMWVRITSIIGDDYEGILDNEPFGLRTVNYGDIVKFKSKNILSTF